MSSLENGISLKRAASRNERNPFPTRLRSRLSRLFLFEKLDYLQWICTVAVFLFFVVFFQMFLPGSVMDKSQDSFLDDKGLVFGELRSLKEMSGLDFGEDIKLEPTKLLEKFQRANKQVNLESPSGFNHSQHRFQYRKPQLALEPFKSILLAVRSREYTSSGQIELVNDWKKVFTRATVVVFPNYALPMIYSTFDSGNYYAIPGSLTAVWKGENTMNLYKDNQRKKMGYGPDKVLIAIVGSQFMYRGLWLEHALILQALLPLFSDFSSDNNSNSHPKIIVLSCDSTGNYSMAVERIALNLRYPSGVVKHVAIDEDVDSVLSMTDLVIYGSFHEESSFPEILMKAMSLGKPIIAPELSNIRKYVDDRVNGYIFPKENIRVLTRIIFQTISNGKLSPLAHNIASIGRGTVKNLMVQETVEGYGFLLENVLKLPSEVAPPPKVVANLPSKLKGKWKWNLFENFLNSTFKDRSYKFLNTLEEQWNHSRREKFGPLIFMDGSFSYEIREEEKKMHVLNTKRRREEQEVIVLGNNMVPKSLAEQFQLSLFTLFLNEDSCSFKCLVVER
ncbi:hypothetical protein F3Y22_tig00111398pilonHSYRG00095 [Hibiscus syriacus]|uniref:Glycosyl transferase family 1 domain-containing protein n=1 Tax=Hibiscus syriacus TaxID=106335 RepID=A0A6A2XSG0_HIBSY|nr:hypothetical protein F3Y22_tig00111398pilonHSYRG00095 [Hibiscus syriacus]